MPHYITKYHIDLKISAGEAVTLQEFRHAIETELKTNVDWPASQSLFAQLEHIVHQRIATSPPPDLHTYNNLHPFSPGDINAIQRSFETMVRYAPNVRDAQ